MDGGGHWTGGRGLVPASMQESLGESSLFNESV